MTEDDVNDGYTDYWVIPDNIDTTGFDFEWRPDMFEPPFIHQFGTQHQRTGGPRFVVALSTDIKYESFQRVKKLPDMSKWEVPDNIDMDSFDFSWHPEDIDTPYIHQFGTQWNKTDGPRYVVPGATQIKYEDSQVARRLPSMKNWRLNKDSDIQEIKFDFSWEPDPSHGKYNYVYGDQYRTAEESIALVYKMGSSYPYKYMSEPRAEIIYKPLDIIYLSNGETGEQRRYNRLCELAGREVTWVKGINGRENAIRHAASISKTKWFILFPAKVYASDMFDFNFQPIRWHEPKHYIFYSTNPLNGLEYGHQAAVCYNKQLVLETIDYGLDFTMSKLHDIVPVSCGVAEYNSDLLMTWRTAFREVIKLLAAGDPESTERLEVWRTYARGEFAEWSIIGAEDGVNYYNQVAGDHEKLMLTFEWAWLKDYFTTRYPGVLV